MRRSFHVRLDVELRMVKGGVVRMAEAREDGRGLFKCRSNVGICVEGFKERLHRRARRGSEGRQRCELQCTGGIEIFECSSGVGLCVDGRLSEER